MTNKSNHPNTSFWLLITMAVILVGIGAEKLLSEQADSDVFTPGLTNLKNIDEFQTRFNQDQDKIRLILLPSPS